METQILSPKVLKSSVSYVASKEQKLVVLFDPNGTFELLVKNAIQQNLKHGIEMVNKITLGPTKVNGNHPMVIFKNYTASTVFLDFDANEPYVLPTLSEVAEAISKVEPHECPACHVMMTDEVNGVCSDWCAYHGYYMIGKRLRTTKWFPKKRPPHLISR